MTSPLHREGRFFGIFCKKIGRIASEDVVIQLLKLKCIAVLLYALEVCNLSKRDLHSLDFTVNGFLKYYFEQVVRLCLWLIIVNESSRLTCTYCYVIIKRQSEKLHVAPQFSPARTHVAVSL